MAGVKLRAARLLISTPSLVNFFRLFISFALKRPLSTTFYCSFEAPTVTHFTQPFTRQWTHLLSESEHGFQFWFTVLCIRYLVSNALFLSIVAWGIMLRAALLQRIQTCWQYRLGKLPFGSGWWEEEAYEAWCDSLLCFTCVVFSRHNTCYPQPNIRACTTQMCIFGRALLQAALSTCFNGTSVWLPAHNSCVR